MERIILTLDLGGTTVKAGLFSNGKLEETADWRHDYKDCEQDQAKDDILARSKKFSGNHVVAIGLSVAGLIASDNTLYRSTVLTSLEGFDIGNFLQRGLSASRFSIDNDGDCGAIGEYSSVGHELFYVAVGSGIGSAFVESDGRIKYLVRINRSLCFSDEMNHPISDIGLRIAFPKEQIYQTFAGFGIKQETVEDVLTLDNQDDRIKSWRLGSAIGVRKILEVLWEGRFYDQQTISYYEGYFKCCGLPPETALCDLYDERYAAKTMALLAREGEPYSSRAYQLMGTFLGQTITEAEKILFDDLGRFPPVYLGGQVMASNDLFLLPLKESVRNCGIDTEIILSRVFLRGENPNLWGAYHQVRQEGNKICPGQK